MKSIESYTYPPIFDGSEFVDRFVGYVDLSQMGDSVGFSTMQLSPQPDVEESHIDRIVDAMLMANDRGVDASFAVDINYVLKMSRIGNRDYPNYLPLLSAEERQERRVNKKAAHDLLELLAGKSMLRQSGVRLTERDYTPRLRDWASLHIAQIMAVKHAKEAHLEPAIGEPIALITTANGTDSDLAQMNNLAVEVRGELAHFVINAMKAGFGHTVGGQRCDEGNVSVLYDFNNRGDPGSHSGIVNEALITIDPRMDRVIKVPTKTKAKGLTHLYYGSQYLPDGRVFKSLQEAGKHADIYIPRQPAGDHRLDAFPYNLHSAIYGWRLDRSGIYRNVRENSSHLKAIVARYDDGTARIIVSTDNFLVHLQKFLRNEELAIVIELDLKRDKDCEYFEGVVNKLGKMGELDDISVNDMLSI